MLYKNVASQGLYLFAYDTNANAAKTGDAANITGNVSKDGAASAGFGTSHPTEIGGGVYWHPMTQGETNADQVAAYWSSTTANIQIDPVFAGTAPGTGSGFTAANVTVATNLDKTGYSITGNVTVGGYATGQDPFTLILLADWTGQTGEASKSGLNALRLLRNKWVVSGGRLNVYKEDGVTVAWTETVSLDPAAQPVTGTGG